MSTLASEFVAAAGDRMGISFEHHFKPNKCYYGRITKDGCFEKGLGPDNYDCSGLVIASLCEVLGMEVSSFPPEFRHALQMESLTVPNAKPEPGDIKIGRNKNNQSHLGIIDFDGDIIHASGKSGKVDKTPTILSRAPKLEVIPFDNLLEVSTAGR